MTSFVAVDASLWVARLVPQDAFHAVVRAWMDARRAQGIEFLSPALLLAETAGALSRRTGDADLALRAVRRLEKLPGLGLVEMDSALLRSAARLAAKFGLRGTDATYVAVADSLRIPLATLDEDQRRRAARHVKFIDLQAG